MDQRVSKKLREDFRVKMQLQKESVNLKLLLDQPQSLLSKYLMHGALLTGTL